MRTALSALLASLLVASPARALQYVTTCGQSVQGTGRLSGDLDCTGYAGDAIQLLGTLHLDGHTVRGHPGHDVVRCGTGRCRIKGSGVIVGGANGVRADGNVTVKGNGIQFPSDAVIITQNGGDGVRAGKTATVSGATIYTNGGDGIRAGVNAKLTTVFLADNGGDNVRAEGNATLKIVTLIRAGGRGVDVQATARGAGLQVRSSGLDGVRAAAVTFTEYDIVENGASAACGMSETCADLATATRPTLRESPNAVNECGTSRNTATGETWGVCAGD